MEHILNIPEISESMRCWMLRTNKGYFYSEYIESGFAAIGWNCVRNENLYDWSDSLKERIQSLYGDKKPGSALSKCRRFVDEIKEGDLLLIVGNDRVSFAVAGEYYEDMSFGLDQEIKANKIIDSTQIDPELRCPYIKRRRIKLLREIIGMEKLGPVLCRPVMLNMHSLSCLDDYTDVILEHAYSLFYRNGKLTASFRVESLNAIDAFSLLDFTRSAANIISLGRQRELAIKTSIRSPGDITFILELTKEYWYIVLIVYLIIFGGKFKDLEFNSLISAFKAFIDRHYNKRKKELELEGMALDNALKRQTLEQKRVLLEKEKAAVTRLIDDNAENIYVKSAELKIAPEDMLAMTEENFEKALKELLNGNDRNALS